MEKFLRVEPDAFIMKALYRKKIFCNILLHVKSNNTYLWTSALDYSQLAMLFIKAGSVRGRQTIKIQVKEKVIRAVWWTTFLGRLVLFQPWHRTVIGILVTAILFYYLRSADPKPNDLADLLRGVWHYSRFPVYGGTVLQRTIRGATRVP